VGAAGSSPSGETTKELWEFHCSGNAGSRPAACALNAAFAVELGKRILSLLAGQDGGAKLTQRIAAFVERLFGLHQFAPRSATMLA
jgi:hypothetical protein